MGIKQQLLLQVQRDDDFAFDIPSVQLGMPALQASFQHDIVRFLEADTYSTAWELAPSVLGNATGVHGKWQDSVRCLVEAMDSIERTAVTRREHRLHLLHLVNVFLLGLYLYHASERVREAFDRWIRATTPPKEYVLNGVRCGWRYSGGSEYGEFLYRWRLASTAHDIGTLISVAGWDPELVRARQEELFRACGATDPHGSFRRSTVCNLCALRMLNRHVAEFSLLCHAMTHHVWPLGGSVYREHGLHGALTLMEAMRLLFEQHGAEGGAPVVDKIGVGLVVWDQLLLETSILHALQAVALHNVDIHTPAYVGGHLPPLRLCASIGRCATGRRLYDLDERPLAWLLKISDSLQEWDKPSLRELGDRVNLARMTDDPVMEIDWESPLGRFVVGGLTAEQVAKLARVEKLTSPRGLFEFRQAP